MSAAERVTPATEPAAWGEICKRYPNAWVCLLDVDHEPDGSIRAARVICQDRSILQVLDQLGTSNPDATIVHTWGRPLRTPRIEIVDESRVLIRARR